TEVKKEEKKKSVAGVQTSLFFTNAPETLVAPSLESEVEVELSATTQYKTIHDVKHKYEVVDTAEKRKALIADLSKQKSFCFDTETTGVDTNNTELVGMSFSFKPFEAYYVPVPENYNEALGIVNEFKNVFENEKIDKLAQNLKFDM